MKIKILTIFSLAAIFVFGACRSADNANTANTANMNMNVNMTATTPMTTPMTNTAGAADPTAKANVESALRKAGYNDVTVDAYANERPKPERPAPYKRAMWRAERLSRLDRGIRPFRETG